MNTSRSAFTLMEILVVIALLVTLMGIGMAGMRAADTFAKESRTKTTISKLNQFVMEKYASYQYRLVPGSDPQKRLQNLYRMMRYEMPDHKSEVNNYSPQRIQSGPIDSDSEIGSAELLYLIVMGMPEAESAFTSMEIADTNHNGTNEFVDGWGNPIYFIRWPAGHSDGNNNNTVISKIQTGNDPNPFDPESIGSSHYAVFPLIFSAGPDRETGINMESGAEPCTNTTGGAGSVSDASSYYDNITNHNL